MRLISLITLLIAIFLSACKNSASKLISTQYNLFSNDQKDLVLKTFYNPDEGSVLALGYGFSPFEPDVPKDAPFNIVTEDIDSNASLSSSIEVNAVFNQQDLARSLDYDESASVSIIGNIGGKLGGSRKISKSSTFSETDFTLVFKARSQYGLKRIKSLTWKEDARKLYEDNDTAFSRQYGTKYVVAKSLGTSIYIVVNFHNVKKTYKEQIENKVEAGLSFKVFSASASSTMKKMMKEAIDNGTLDYTVISTGGLGKFTNSTDIIQLLAQDTLSGSFLNFHALDTALDNFISGNDFKAETAVPTGFYCVDYSDLGLNKIQPFRFEHNQQILLQSISNQYDYYVQIFEHVNSVVNERSPERGVLSTDKLNRLQSSLTELSTYLDSLKQYYRQVLDGDLTSSPPTKIEDPLKYLNITFSTEPISNTEDNLNHLDSFNYIIRGKYIDLVYLEAENGSNIIRNSGEQLVVPERIVTIYNYLNINHKTDSAGSWTGNDSAIFISDNFLRGRNNSLPKLDSLINASYKSVPGNSGESYINLYIVASNVFGMTRKVMLGKIYLCNCSTYNPKILYNIREPYE